MKENKINIKEQKEIFLTFVPRRRKYKEIKFILKEKSRSVIKNKIPVELNGRNGLSITKEYDGDLKLEDLEKRLLPFLKDQIVERNVSLNDLGKEIKEIKDKYNKISFHLLDKSDGLINTLKNNEVKCKNIDNMSCYISTYLTSFINIIFPEAMKEYEKFKKKKIQDFDELKSKEDKDKFYDVVIDTVIKKADEIQRFGNGGIDSSGHNQIVPKEICELRNLKFLGDELIHQGLMCLMEINKAIKDFCEQSKKLRKKIKKFSTTFLTQTHLKKKFQIKN